jgi:hypothetical protein
MKRASFFMKQVKTMRLVLPLCFCLTTLSQNVLAAERPNVLWLTTEDNSPYSRSLYATGPSLPSTARPAWVHRRTAAQLPTLLLFKLRQQRSERSSADGLAGAPQQPNGASLLSKNRFAKCSCRPSSRWRLASPSVRREGEQLARTINEKSVIRT